MAVDVPTIQLHGKAKNRVDAAVMICRVYRKGDGDALTDDVRFDPDDLTIAVPVAEERMVIPAELHHLRTGDIVRLDPQQGDVWVMYRKHSHQNSMLLTERCNSWCIMCSQPPKKKDDSFLIDDWKRAVPLMSSDTIELGITGGEPLLTGEGFFELLGLCRKHLPSTAIHVLTNGRLFVDEALAVRLASLEHPDLMLGIPLYSDIAWRHDFIVQAPGAYDETIRGMMNLARAGVPIELRVVVHRYTLPRLNDLATFVTRNLPFVDHVAIMGLEPIGFGRTNLDALWVDPHECVPGIDAAVQTLTAAGIRTFLFNFQLCLLPEELWPFAVKSISDWKTIFIDTCKECVVKQHCSGFFHSANKSHSAHIRAIQHTNYYFQ